LIDEVENMRCVSILIAVLLLWAPARAQISPVSISVAPGLEAAGFLVRRGDQCIVITAAHAVDRYIDATITYRMQTFDANLQWAGSKLRDAVDVAVMAPKVDLQAQCVALPEEAALVRALDLPEGFLWLQDPGGDILTPRVNIVSKDVFGGKITVEVLDEPERFATAGVSGAALVFGGYPVAVVSGNAGPHLVAHRLDHIMAIASKVLPSGSDDRGRKPFDLSLVDSDVREVVEQARLVRRQSEGISRRARAIEVLADEIAASVREMPLDFELRGRGRFISRNDSVYAGELSVRQGPGGEQFLEPVGAGVLTIQSGPLRGQVIKCMRRAETGCHGPGTVDNGSLSYWRRVETELQQDRLVGPSRLVGEDGSVCYANLLPQHAGMSASEVSGYGVFQQPDGQVFEGMLGPSCSLSGVGVLWDRQGRLMRAGRWESGRADRSR
jgi:hypothetical protein